MPFLSGYLEQVLGQVWVGQAGRDGSGAPDNRLGQVDESDVAVEGEAVEVRVDQDLLDLYELLTWIPALLVMVSCRDTEL